jgi:hypothetical protein
MKSASFAVLALYAVNGAGFQKASRQCLEYQDVVGPTNR